MTSNSKEEILKEIALLTIKPVIYAANLSEDDFKNDYEKNIESNRNYWSNDNIIIMCLSARHYTSGNNNRSKGS